MEENKEKAQFFALYLHQKILPLKIWGSANHVNHYLLGGRALEESYLELIPLSAITDEDAVEVAKILLKGKEIEKAAMIWHGKNMADDLHNGETVHLSSTVFVNVIDYLRSKGYALPWKNYSVEDLENKGWLKLKQL